MAFEFGMFHEFQRPAGITEEEAFARAAGKKQSSCPDGSCAVETPKTVAG